jgi:L-histidine N-alpha-methyltransferase
MHLRSRTAQSAVVGGRVIRFAEGETIHTENSYKYSLDDFRELARSAGFVPVKAWTDPDKLFSIHYLETARRA